MATDDLKARLRSVDVSWSEVGEWCAEAADALATLEAQLAARDALLELAREHLHDATIFLDGDDWRADVGRLVASIDEAIASGAYKDETT